MCRLSVCLNDMRSPRPFLPPPPLFRPCPFPFLGAEGPWQLISVTVCWDPQAKPPQRPHPPTCPTPPPYPTPPSPKTLLHLLRDPRAGILSPQWNRSHLLSASSTSVQGAYPLTCLLYPPTADSQRSQGCAWAGQQAGTRAKATNLHQQFCNESKPRGFTHNSRTEHRGPGHAAHLLLV